MQKKYVWTLILVFGTSLGYWFFAGFQPAPNIIEAEVSHRETSPQTDSFSKVEKQTFVSSSPTIERTSGYLGSDSCKKCHEDYHQSWHTSYHRTMTQPVTPDTAPKAFFGDTIELQGETFKFSRRGDEFFVELNDPIENGKRMTRRLVLMTGSHHMQVFWYESGINMTPAQLQIMYYIEQQRWIPRRSAFLRPPNMEKEHELGRWNGICCNCHTTHPRSRPGSGLLGLGH